MSVITMIDPHKGVAWNEHLQWMLDHRGVIAWLLYEGEQLVEYLNSFVAHRVEYRGALMARGLTKAQIDEHLVSQLLNQFSSHDDKAVTAEQREEIMEFVEALEPATYEVEV